MATRQTSAIVLNKLAAVMPQLMGGSADLAPSNLSDMKDTDEIKYGTFAPDSYEGRNIHFGIREHAMAAIANGMQLHAVFRPTAPPSSSSPITASPPCGWRRS